MIKTNKSKYWAVTTFGIILRVFGILNLFGCTITAFQIAFHADKNDQIMGISSGQFSVTLITFGVVVFFFCFAIAQLMEALISIQGKTKAEGQYQILEKIALELEEQNNLLREANPPKKENIKPTNPIKLEE